MIAQEKLEEAKYFLDQLERSIENANQFKYNLSAFLSAARSVTWYLQNEFHDDPNFQSWYESKQEKMNEDALLKFFKEKRNYIVKEKYGNLRQQVSVSISGNAYAAASLPLKVIRANGTVEERKAA